MNAHCLRDAVMRGLVLLVACAFVTGLVYVQVWHHRFLNWDDIDFYVGNPHLRGFTAPNLYWVFTSSGDGIWKPLTWLTFMAEFRWLGDAPGPHLLINPAIHALNATLVGWLVFRTLSLPSLAGILPAQGQRYAAGLLAAVWFAVHPLEVEAATWLSGRKEVLCAFFYLLSVVLWVQRLHEPARSRLWASLSWLAQLLAILSKPMAVTLPVVLVLLDMAARRPEPVWKLVLGKWPFWLLSAFIVPVALWAQKAVGALPDVEHVGLGVRYAQGVDSYVSYLAKFLLPVNLSPYYPAFRSIDLSRVCVNSAAVVFLLGLAWRDYRHGTRGWFLVILWYLAVFFPVAGWVQVSGHRVADRYAYLPAIALFAGAAVMLVRVLWDHRLVLALAVLALAAGMGTLASQQVSIWKNNRTLWEFALERQPDAMFILVNAAAARLDDGDVAGAIVAGRRALEDHVEKLPLWNLIRAYDVAHAWPEMLAFAQAGMAYYPEDDRFPLQAAQALVMLGRYPEALDLYARILQLRPANVYALWGTAYALSMQGHRAEALATLDRLLAIAPGHPPALALQKQLHDAEGQ